MTRILGGSGGLLFNSGNEISYRRFWPVEKVVSQSRLNFQRLAFSLGCLLMLHLLPVRDAFADVTQWVDIEVSGGHILVETEIAEVAGHAIIDTGAQINGINARFLATEELSFKKGRPIDIAGVFSKSRRSTYREIPVKIFGIEIPFERLVDLDIGPPDTQLIIGAGFLQLFVVQVDYPNQRMRLITHDSVNLKKTKNVDSKRNPKGGSPLVKVGLSDEKEVWLTMDTGATGGVVIDRKIARKLNWLDVYPTLDRTAYGVNSSGQMEHFNVPSITFGGYEIENPIVSVPAEGESIALFEGNVPIGSRVPRGGASKGLLGYDVLKHFVMTIDYKNGHVHIEPGDKLPEEQ